jgi:hypothetical protein
MQITRVFDGRVQIQPGGNPTSVVGLLLGTSEEAFYLVNVQAVTPAPEARVILWEDTAIQPSPFGPGGRELVLRSSSPSPVLARVSVIRVIPDA